MAKTFKIKTKDFSRAIALNSDVQNLLENIAKERVDKARQELIDEFENHIVSKEIEEGPDAQNISGTLGGYGNLFSFIGFPYGSKPITDFIQTLYKYIRLREGSVKINIRGDNIELQYQAIVPVDNEIENRTKMPWESGRSWLFAIERGISGFSQYINRRFIPASRSTAGVQTKNKIHPGEVYRRTSYWTKMYNKLVKNIRK